MPLLIGLLLFAGVALAQSVTLTAEQGYSGRNPRPGAVAHVFARQNTATQVFDRWTGDIEFLLDPLAPYTTLVMPNRDVRVRANYRTVPSWSALTATFNGAVVTYYIPPSPLALIFYFHGTGGTGASLVQNSEFLSLARDFVAAGFGVAGFDCLNRTTGQWDTATTGSSNPDIVRLNGVIAAMKAQSVIAQDLPLFAWGHSNGGQFSHFSSLVMNWRAVGISSVQGSPTAATTYAGPVMWWMAKNDDHPQVGQVGGVQTSIDRWLQIANRRILSRHVITGPMPFYPERLTRSIVLTLQDSLEVYNLLRTNGFLDENDFLTRNPNEGYWRNLLPARYTENMRLGVGSQLEATYTTHEYGNYVPHLFIDLFLKALGRRPASPPINAASFTGASVAPASIATVFTEGLASTLVNRPEGALTGLGGVTGTLRSSTGTENSTPWFYVSPGQGSFLMPEVAPGSYVLKIVSGDRRVALPTTVAAVAPGIFTANGNGQGVPAAVILRVTPNNDRAIEYPFAADAAGFEAAPIRFGEDRLFIDLYATGVRGSTDVQIVIGGETVAPLFAGAQSQFPGLDQVTFELPRSFAGRKVDVVIVAGGVRSNTGELRFN